MKRVLIVFALLLGVASLQAQTEPVGRYLFRQFDRGFGKMKRGMPISDVFNYDVVDEQMQFLDNGDRMALDMPDLDTLVIDNRVFVPVGKKFAECFRLDNGVELKVLWHFRQTEKGREGAYGISTQAGGVYNILVGDYTGEHAYQDYEPLKDIDTYSYTSLNTYLAVVKGKTYKFHDAKSFAKAFKLQQDEVSATMKSHNWYFGSAKDVAKLLNSMEFK